MINFRKLETVSVCTNYKCVTIECRFVPKPMCDMIITYSQIQMLLPRFPCLTTLICDLEPRITCSLPPPFLCKFLSIITKADVKASPPIDSASTWYFFLEIHLIMQRSAYVFSHTLFVQMIVCKWKYYLVFKAGGVSLTPPVVFPKMCLLERG